MVVRRFPAQLVVLLHLSVFTVSVGAGWGTAEGSLAPRPVDGVWQEAVAVASHNARTVCVLAVASLTTGGLGGLFLFGVNGYAFGKMLGMAPAAKVHWVLLYAPVEVWAFTVASVAATRWSWMTACWLLRQHAAPAAGRHAGVTVTVVAGILAAAALLEALAIQGAWGDD